MGFDTLICTAVSVGIRDSSFLYLQKWIIGVFLGVVGLVLLVSTRGSGVSCAHSG